MSSRGAACGFAAFLAIGAMLSSAPASAQEQQGPEQQGPEQLGSEQLGDDDSVNLAGDGIDGVATVNLAAGTVNQQANVGIIAMGGIGSAVGVVDQALTTPGAEYTAHGSVEIADGAFAHSNGWIAANLAAGSANQQANINLMATGIDGKVASADVLGQIRGPVAPTTESEDPSPSSEASVRIGDRAFENSSGLVQLSMIAGDRNSTANVFAMTVAGAVN